MTEQLNCDVRIHQPSPPQRTKFPDRLAITGDDERLPLIQCPQDPPAVVTQFALTDFFGHTQA
ncbi:hypothetical protein BA059_20145 [Mycolicibacterium sp. (ex Dasyatis americana)]|uniref:Uncharacterized protein n=1 Tax=Mycobacterium syngnathidarum TaxID=1908205 RepID=A0A1S1KEE2_9MYCO|nr:MULTISPECIES: hypothetical protein [Mycobacterium]OFB37231.1 hypothetical protein BA059_20145 [Mycolicibacterium sp. (ex Dasyatis americana)]OHU05595.1 hypothetical protein BKG61_06785 [Mycobacterium syngnathidarum]OLT87804.1 hypothetical protein BKG60_25820 [Mycobacterium syngnathidarum]